jgi:NADPH:quinone reductase-like Zn-dependent oxidoreductase
MNIVPFLFRKSPAIPETDFAGVIIAVGDKVLTAPPKDGSTNQYRFFPPGAEVFGSIPVGLHLRGGVGALAEYVVVEVDSIARKSSKISFEQASCIPVSGATALTLVDTAKLETGQRVLINSPCGGVGHFATQIARKALGSSGNITGICSAANYSTAKELGCDDVLNYHSAADGGSLESRLKFQYGEENAFDTILDAYGSQPLWHSAPSYLKSGPGHSYTTVGPATTYSIGGMFGVVGKMISNAATPVWIGGVNREYRQISSFVDTGLLERLRALVQEGDLKVVIGEVWAMEDALQVSIYSQISWSYEKANLVKRHLRGYSVGTPKENWLSRYGSPETRSISFSPWSLT